MKAVVLAGGKGARLAPYTRILPKPLMPIGDMPILEILLRQMKRAGLMEIILTVGHLEHLLRAFFQDGKRLGLQIDYSYEEQPLGTAGPLSLIADRLDQTFLVANGDVLTTLDLAELIAAHRKSGAMATIASHARKVNIDFGVLQFDGENVVKGYIEKPSFDYSVSMGLYVFEPGVLDYIPKNMYLDFPDLVLKLIEHEERVRAYRYDGYWQDLGRPDDYENAIQDFDRLRPLILGEGEGKMAWRVPLADLDFGEVRIRAVLEVLNSRWLSMGERTLEFERLFAEKIGIRYAFGVSNGTVGLHLACLALGIGPGDEVIVPSLSFVATSNAVLYTGAEVRFADILGMDEPTISPKEVERLINPKTRAVIVMHYGGYPCRMNEIQAIAQRHKIAVIEDAAHAPGGSLEGRKLGSWGDVSCFSFFSNKNIATGEGGMVVTNREDLAEKVRSRRSHGMTSLTWDRHQGHAYSYDVVDLGYNYRLDEIRSALGIVQLGKLEDNNARRGAISEQYRRSLEGLGFQIPFDEQTKRDTVSPAYHIFPILLPEGREAGCIYGWDALRGHSNQHPLPTDPSFQLLSKPRSKDPAANNRSVCQARSHPSAVCVNERWRTRNRDPRSPEVYEWKLDNTSCSAENTPGC